MAESFAKVPDIITFVTGAANVATKVNIPNAGRKVTVFFVTDPGKIAIDGVDTDPIDAAHATVDADRYFEMAVDQDADERGKGPAAVYVATAAGGTTVKAIVEAL